MRAKREPEKHPLLSRRGRHEKGAARPFQTPKELSKHKNASRFAKRIFCTSPVYGSADGVTLQQAFTFCKGVKSAAKQQMGETRKKRLAQRLAFFRFDFHIGIVKGEQPLVCNGDDRGQRPKQGGAVGAAACRMRVPRKARSRRREPQPAASRASKVAGAFLVLFWHAKENINLA